MNTLKRHKVSKNMLDGLEWLLELKDDRISKLETQARTNYRFIESIEKESKEAFIILEILNNKENRKKVLSTTLSSSLNILQLKSSPGKEFPIDIDGKGPVMLKADEEDSEIHLDLWYNAFFLSKILRQKKIDFLYSISTEKIPTITKDYRVIFHNTFLFYHSIDKPQISILDSVIDYIDEHFKNNLSPKTGLYETYDVFLLNNEIRTLKALVEDKPEDFNKNLYAALEDHKAFWGQKRGLNKGEAPLCDDPEGFISWPLTALAAMAHDKGFKIEVESDYIPKFMVEGNFSE